MSSFFIVYPIKILPFQSWRILLSCMHGFDLCDDVQKPVQIIIKQSNHPQSMKQQFDMQYDEESTFLNLNAKSIILQELISISWKIRYVILMLPQHREQSINYLKKWDLWGPMIICLFFAIPLAMVSENPQYQEDFINVFLIFWIGALLISVNCKLLGSKGSLLLIISTLGYCLVPLAIIGFATSLLHWVLPTALKLILVCLGLSWSSISCMLIMRDLVSQERKWLCTYPIFLFYIFHAWYSIVA